MTKDQVFAALAKRGADRAVASFSGGNDEGGVDEITLYKGDEVVGELQGYYHDAPDDDKELIQAISSPVQDRYGSFAGDFHVSGLVTWSAALGTATMSKEETEYVHEEFEV